MKFNSKNHSKNNLLKLYKLLLKPRIIEERMLLLLRQGKISKWFSGIGQEAISVGVSAAIRKDEYILTLHRNLGVFTSRDVPVDKLTAQFQGKATGYTKGRDRSFHFGSKDHHIVGMISHLGPQMAVADGIALATLLQKRKKVTVVFCGDGGASEGDFHEALNVAAVWDLPVIFVIENNGYGLSTPSKEQFRFNSFTDKGAAYGVDALKIDGNNLLEVYDTIDQVAKNIRTNPKPVIVEAVTFRMRGHEEASGTKYVPEELFKKWAEKDPVLNFEKFLLKERVLDQDQLKAIREKMVKDLQKDIDKGLKATDVKIDTATELNDLFAPFNQKALPPKKATTKELRFVDAITDGLTLALKKHKNLILMGQDIAEYGGVFKVTEGFVGQFGKNRIRNTPLCESAIIGAGFGLSIAGYKSVIEMQFADFVTCGFNQIVNNLAKSHYRWGQNADVVIRMPTGAGVGAGPFHSQSTEAWFFHVPGLKIVYPSSPSEAKGLLLQAIEDPNPVLFFEHKFLYRSEKGDVNTDYYTLPIGEAQLVQEGDDISIITYGMGVHWAKEVTEELNAAADILDLRSLQPWDKAAVEQTVKKTGKVLLVTEDTLTGSIISEISAYISENLFENLDAPVMRAGSLDTPVPFNKGLEANFLPKERMKAKLEALLEF